MSNDYKKLKLKRNRLANKYLSLYDNKLTLPKEGDIIDKLKTVKPLTFWAALFKEMSLLLDYILVNYSNKKNMKWNWLAIGKHLKLGFYVFNMIKRIINT